MNNHLDCVIIGGGIAGLQASIQLGRYNRNVLVIDSNYGRSSICKSYRNILGWPDGISGEQLRTLGQKHTSEYTVEFVEDKVITVSKMDDFFKITTESGKIFIAKTILISTGIMDHIPEIKNIKECLGISMFVCPDCDGYEVTNKSVLLLGAGSAGANLALTLTYWTNKITFINHASEEIDSNLKQKLRNAGIQYRNEIVEEVLIEEGTKFKGVKIQTGESLFADRGFIGFGGNEIHNEIAKQLGIELVNNKHIIVDQRTKETNVTNVWAAGDIVAHSQQATIAMGEGSQAAIWIHKRLLKMDD